MSDFLKKLQDKPYAARVRILWATVGVVGAILIVIFVINIRTAVKSSITRPTTQNITANASQPATDLKLIKADLVEQQGKTLKIYFNINNATADILNLPKAEDVTLTLNGQSLHPSQILDRQAQPFIQKVLSHTQNFGTLIFDNASGTKAELVFDQMFFESTPEQLFSQTLDLDFNQLKNSEPLKH